MNKLAKQRRSFTERKIWLIIVFKNDENTLIIKNAPQKGQELTSFFNELWDSIPEKWLKNDPKPESVDSGSSCFDGIDNDFDKIIDKAEADCRK